MAHLDKRVQDKAGGAQQLPPAPDGQVSEPEPALEPAGGALVRTLSELLGVEVGIQADRKALEKGLVLLEHGKDGSRWQIVLSEPKEPVASVVKKETKPKGEKEPLAKKDEPEKRPFELRPGSEPTAAVPAWALVVAAILILTVAWRSSRRSAVEITADSKDFQDALKIWLPWLMAKQGTPRAVKRFVNWLRYIAVRLRKAAGSEEGRFPEPNTVALAAIRYLESRWLADGPAFERVTAGNLQELIEEDFVDAENKESLAQILASSVESYAAWVQEQPEERGAWPPSDEHRKAFLDVINE